MPTYHFEKTSVVCSMYDVEANSEEEARRLLETDCGPYFGGDAEPMSLAYAKEHDVKDGYVLTHVDEEGE